MLREILETNRSQVFEAVNQDYKNQMIEIFNKAIRDELSASISYKAMAEKIYGAGNSKLKEELIQHGNEEHEHFNELITYAASHGILKDLVISIDEKVISNAPSNVKGIINFSQNLELEAIKDYRNASKLAFENGDMETHGFFAELAGDEEGHYDDVSVYTGKTREFGPLE